MNEKANHSPGWDSKRPTRGRGPDWVTSRSCGQNKHLQASRDSFWFTVAFPPNLATPPRGGQPCRDIKSGMVAQHLRIRKPPSKTRRTTPPCGIPRVQHQGFTNTEQPCNLHSLHTPVPHAQQNPKETYYAPIVRSDASRSPSPSCITGRAPGMDSQTSPLVAP